MSITRKDFLKLSGTAIAGAVLGGGLISKSLKDEDKLFGCKIEKAACPLCQVGCTINLFLKDGNIVHLEGDKDSEINSGKLCAYGLSLGSFYKSKNRLKKVRYRAPYGANWTDTTLDDSIERIARRIKKVRDESFIEREKGLPVNATDSIVGLCGDFVSNEEAYLFNKFCRTLGISRVVTDENFRQNNSDKVIGSSLGLPAATSDWKDLLNSDYVLILGADPVEEIPMAMKYLVSLREEGKKIITVDSVYTKTAAMSDLFVPIAPGSLTTFVNGLIYYSIKNLQFNREYLSLYTNVSYLLDDEFRFDNNSEKFSGYKEKQTYYKDMSSWKFKLDGRGNPGYDSDLRHPRSVFRFMDKFYSNFDAQRVVNDTGAKAADFLMVAELFTASYLKDKRGAVVHGSRIGSGVAYDSSLKSALILQLMLGNIGGSGGGIFVSGEKGNTRGVKDQLGSWNGLPGFLDLPNKSEIDLKTYLRNRVSTSKKKKNEKKLGFLTDHITNLLMAWYGEKANYNNEYLFNLLPRVRKKDRLKNLIGDIYKGRVKGAILLGSDLINSGYNRRTLSDLLSRLEWLVVIDVFESETSNFWKENDKLLTKSATEVFLLPVSFLLENPGSVTSSTRTIQYNKKFLQGDKAIESASHILSKIFIEIKDSYGQYGGAFPEPIEKVNWPYGERKDIEDMLNRELTGYSIQGDSPIENIQSLKNSGKSACGNWLYAGQRNNFMMNDFSQWKWPSNEKLLYGQASFNKKGTHWSKKDWETEKDKSLPFEAQTEGLARVFDEKNIHGPLPIYNEYIDELLNDDNQIKTSRRLEKKYKIYDLFSQVESFNRDRLFMMEWVEEKDFHTTYCEIGLELAQVAGLKSGDEVKLLSAYGLITVPVVVTSRIINYTIKGKKFNFCKINGDKGLDLTGDLNYRVPFFKTKLLVEVS